MAATLPSRSGAPTALTVTCMACGTRHEGNRALTTCPACGGLLDADIDLSQRLTPDDFTAVARNHRGPGQASGVSASCCRPSLSDAIVTRCEGNTPLYRDQRLADYAGLTGGSFRIKHEGHNPTASFKDRGMTVAVSHAKSVRARGSSPAPRPATRRRRSAPMRRRRASRRWSSSRKARSPAAS